MVYRAVPYYSTGALESIEGIEQLWEQSVALFRQTDDRFGLALALGGVSIMALARGDLDRSTALFEEGLRLYREIGDKWGVGAILSHLGIIPLSRGEHEQAARYFEEGLALSREIGDRLTCSISLHNLAWTLRLRGDHEPAVGLYVEGLGVAAELGDKAGVAYCLEGLAGLISPGDEPERKARLFGASEAILETVGAPLYIQIQDRALYQRAVEELRSHLTEEAFKAAWAQGRSMTPEQAIEYALEESRHGTQPPSERANQQLYEPLTARELEVLALISDGLSNQEIADRLFVALSTVKTYVNAIFKKLEVKTRTQAVAKARKLRLLPE